MHRVLTWRHKKTKKKLVQDDLTNFLNVLVQNIQSCNESQGKLGILNWLGTQVCLTCI